MTRVLLDTSAYSAFFRGHAGVVQEVRTADEILFSPVVLGELHAGFRGGTYRLRNKRQLDAFLKSPRVKILSVDSGTALRYGEIVTFLRRGGRPIPTNDIWIGASAMQSGATLVTTDAHFARLPQVLVNLHPPETLQTRK